MEGQAKYALWELVEKGVFVGHSRNGNPIVKTYSGNKDNLINEVLVPVVKDEVGIFTHPQN